MKIIAQCSVLPPEMKILPALVKIPWKKESEPPPQRSIPHEN